MPNNLYNEYLTDEVINIINEEYKRIDEKYFYKKDIIKDIYNYCISKLENNKDEDWLKDKEKVEKVCNYFMNKIEIDRDETKREVYEDILTDSYIEIEGKKAVEKFPEDFIDNKQRKGREIY